MSTYQEWSKVLNSNDHANKESEEKTMFRLRRLWDAGYRLTIKERE